MTSGDVSRSRLNKRTAVVDFKQVWGAECKFIIQQNIDDIFIIYK